MAKRPVVVTLTSGFYSTSQLDTNFSNIQSSFDNTLSRDGSTPNSMSADIDLNSNDLLNVQTANVTTLKIGGVTVIPGDTVSAQTAASDTFSGDGTTVAFTTSIAPGSKDNTQVFIEGVYQMKASYSVSGTTVTFTTAPPDNTSIDINYFTSA